MGSTAEAQTENSFFFLDIEHGDAVKMAHFVYSVLDATP